MKVHKEVDIPGWIQSDRVKFCNSWTRLLKGYQISILYGPETKNYYMEIEGIVYGSRSTVQAAAAALERLMKIPGYMPDRMIR